jgi:hypothetical protein
MMAHMPTPHLHVVVVKTAALTSPLTQVLIWSLSVMDVVRGVVKDSQEKEWRARMRRRGVSEEM